MHHYAAPEGCDLDDVAAWHAANPGILGRYQAAFLHATRKRPRAEYARQISLPFVRST